MNFLTFVRVIACENVHFERLCYDTKIELKRELKASLYEQSQKSLPTDTAIAKTRVRESLYPHGYLPAIF